MMPLSLTQDDLDKIEEIQIRGEQLWDHPNLKYLKDKIRKYLIDDNELPRCCYCYRVFVGESKIDIDTEHILPKSIYKNVIYNPLNLNISCKRCNMTIKNDRIDFIVDLVGMGNDYFHSYHYKFIHPNLDIYLEHLNRKERINGEFVFIKFVVKTEDKGRYTYDFFELKELEIDNINYAQGIKKAKSLNSKVYNIIKISLLKLQKI